MAGALGRGLQRRRRPCAFERLGPDGANGHSLFTHAPEKWKLLVRDFLRAQGYAMPEPGEAFGQARRP